MTSSRRALSTGLVEGSGGTSFGSGQTASARWVTIALVLDAAAGASEQREHESRSRCSGEGRSELQASGG
jgi:hypothetical protein